MKKMRKKKRLNIFNAVCKIFNTPALTRSLANSFELCKLRAAVLRKQNTTSAIKDALQNLWE